MPSRIHVIDSHTEGEPTRLIVGGGPDLGTGTMAERRERFLRDYDYIRSGVVNEPRGSEAVVGAILCTPVDPNAAAGVIYFNNVGFLGMCGHGTIGLVASLKFMGRIKAGSHRIETPVGEVVADLHEDGSISIANVESYRLAAEVAVSVPGYGEVRGDIAYGGNWFFLVGKSHVEVIPENLEELGHYAKAIKTALEEGGVTGADGAEIDHVELFGPPLTESGHSRNYVLCPGGAYDRSPCGTGLSAKLACLAADGKLQPGQEWRQESIIGTLFRGQYAVSDSGIRPVITATAHVTSESSLIFSEEDPLKDGIQL